MFRGVSSERQLPASAEMNMVPRSSVSKRYSKKMTVMCLGSFIGRSDTGSAEVTGRVQLLLALGIVGARLQERSGTLVQLHPHRPQGRLRLSDRACFPSHRISEVIQ